MVSELSAQCWMQFNKSSYLLLKERDTKDLPIEFEVHLTKHTVGLQTQTASPSHLGTSLIHSCRLLRVQME